MKKKIEQVKILLDALPYIKKYAGDIFVIKYGGSAQIDPILKAQVAEDILLMQLVGINVVIVHGGGNKISSFLNKLHIKSTFVDGLRVTDAETMEIVEMVLSGNVNKEITTLINQHGGNALGISGKDANLLMATPIDFEKYGYVGEIRLVNVEVVKKILDEKLIPVIAPIASDNGTNSSLGYNINADFAASQIAIALKARKIIFMTDTPGVMDNSKNILSTLNLQEAEALKKSGVITGGMIPKVDACMEAIKGGVLKSHIIDGRVEHAILLETFTSEGVGTVIKGISKIKKGA